MDALKKQTVSISYWIYPEGDDFEGIEDFEKGTDQEFNIDIKRRKTDALGGGLYELVIEIIQNEEIQEFITDLLKDLGKEVVFKSFRLLFNHIRTLFKKNTDFRPDIERASIKFLDTTIILYPIYETSVQENFEDILEKVANEYLHIKENILDSVESIHIPIFNKIDTYKICQYRVKLNVDENIMEFHKQDYFKFWGIRTTNQDYIYGVKDNSIIRVKFYTQSEYDILYDTERKLGEE